MRCVAKGLAQLVLGFASVACGGRTDLGGGPTGVAGSEPVAACTASDVDGLVGVSAIAADERDVVYWGARADLVRHDDSSTTVLAHVEADSVAALALDGTRVVYMLASGTLNAIPRDGGAPVTLASGIPLYRPLISPRADGSVLVIGGDASHTARIVSVGTNGAVKSVWSSTTSLLSAAVDEAFVYATLATSAGAELLRIDATSGDSTMLVDGLQSVPALALDATRLYVFSVNVNDPKNAKWPNGLLTMPKAGGPLTPFFDPPAPYGGGWLAVDASSVYLTTVFAGETSPPLVTALWRIAADGHGTNLAGDVGTPNAVPVPYAFDAVCSSPRAVHWIVHRSPDTPSAEDSVRELCK